MQKVSSIRSLAYCNGSSLYYCVPSVVVGQCFILVSIVAYSVKLDDSQKNTKPAYGDKSIESTTKCSKELYKKKSNHKQ